MTSVGATMRYLMQNDLRPYCLVENDLIETDFGGVDRKDPNCVLVGLAPSKFSYDKLNEAFRLLAKLKKGEEEAQQHSEGQRIENNSKPHIIAIHRATHYRDSDHELSLGPGGFISLLEQTTGYTAHVIGKPSRNFYQSALSSLGIENPSCAVVVGDDVVGDIQGALDAGLGGAILVKTGKYVSGDELGHKTGGVVPTLVVDSIVEAVDYICSSLE